MVKAACSLAPNKFQLAEKKKITRCGQRGSRNERFAGGYFVRRENELFVHEVTAKTLIETEGAVGATTERQ